MQKVLVAGGAGFIGSHLCKRLLSDKYEVICVDNLSTGAYDNIHPFEQNPHFRFVKHDITKPLSTKIHADVVFHLASPASPNYHSTISYHKLSMETMMANTLGTLELLKFSKKHQAKFLFASTSEVYGDPLEHPQKEEYRGNVSTTGPRSVYDESKRFGETLTAYYIRDLSLDARIARIFNTYGPGMLKEDKRMVVEFITQALLGLPISVFGNGDQTRSLCYIDDMVEGLVRFMFYPHTSGEVINLGAIEEHTVLEYATLIKRLTLSKSEIVLSEELPEDDPKMRRPSIEKAKKLLTWSPEVKLEQGLKRTVEYFKSV